jgi:precorrin-6B methylase 2
MTLKEPSGNWIIASIITNTFWEIADYFAYKSTSAATLYDRIIGADYQVEYEKYGITKAKNILHIGCGPYPLTEIALAAVSKGHVTGIDKNEKVVTKALKVLKQRDTTNRITILHGDGRTFPVTVYDTIIISSCSMPKNEILTHIASNTRPNTHIILREIDIAGPHIEAFLATLPSLHISDKIDHHPFPFIYPTGWFTYQIKKQ